MFYNVLFFFFLAPIGFQIVLFFFFIVLTNIFRACLFRNFVLVTKTDKTRFFTRTSGNIILNCNRHLPLPCVLILYSIGLGLSWTSRTYFPKFPVSRSLIFLLVFQSATRLSITNVSSLTLDRVNINVFSYKIAFSHKISYLHKNKNL